jgi:hypothetical protein
MITSTFLTHNFYKQSGNFSFLLNLAIDSLTGILNFGFSGNSILNFDCKSGKIIDNHNNYVEAYQKNVISNISGNISPTLYDYYINNNPVAFGLSRSIGNLDYFYINPQNCEATFDLFIKGDKPNYSLTNSINFNSGITSIPIAITNNSLPFRIFSGIYQGISSKASLSGVPMNVPTGTTVFYINQSGLSGAVTFPFQLLTNFGTQGFVISGFGS